MNEAVIVNAGFTRVGELWNKDIEDIAFEAIKKALDGYDGDIDALYIGNMLSSYSSIQGNLGAYIADLIGYRDISALSIDAAEASSGMAVYQAILSIHAGQNNVVLAGGVEKMTDILTDEAVEGLTLGMNRELAIRSGLSIPSVAAILMAMYMERYKVPKENITYLSVQDHEHASTAQHSQFKSRVSLDMAMRSPVIADPLTIFDASPISDGAAFLLLMNKDLADDLGLSYVKIVGMGVSTDTTTITDREDPIEFVSTRRAAEKALAQADLDINEMSIIEINDDYSITGILALEAIGLYRHGEAPKHIRNGETSIRGSHPVNTFGGSKARGHPVGATGAYQLSEIYLQLTGRAGQNQVSNPKFGLSQINGGLDSISVVFIIGR